MLLHSKLNYRSYLILNNSGVPGTSLKSAGLSSSTRLPYNGPWIPTSWLRAPTPPCWIFNDAIVQQMTRLVLFSSLLLISKKKELELEKKKANNWNFIFTNWLLIRSSAAQTSESDGCIKCSFVLYKVVRGRGGWQGQGLRGWGLDQVGVTKESNFLNWEPRCRRLNPRHRFWNFWNEKTSEDYLLRNWDHL